MKKLGIILLGLLAAFPLYAQDPGADASAPPADATATEPAPAEVVPADAAPVEAAPVEPTAEAPPAESAPTETAAPADPATEAAPPDATATAEPAPVEAPVEEASSEPVEEKPPLIFYVGADYGSATVSISNLEGFPVTDTESTMYRGRIGMRIHEAIGLEAHFGMGQEDDSVPNAATLDTYYGIYIVPTGTLLDVVEFGFPLGFAWAKVKSNSASQALDGVSYGMNVEFPFKLLVESSPDIRIGGGGMVYQQNNSARTYGWHAGIRFDFAI